jgi:hypothetical protein
MLRIIGGFWRGHERHQHIAVARDRTAQFRKKRFAPAPYGGQTLFRLMRGRYGRFKLREKRPSPQNVLQVAAGLGG